MCTQSGQTDTSGAVSTLLQLHGKRLSEKEARPCLGGRKQVLGMTDGPQVTSGTSLGLLWIAKEQKAMHRHASQGQEGKVTFFLEYYTLQLAIH